MANELLLLTWNLHDNVAAFDLACDYLARRTAEGFLCVAAFQEAPATLSVAATHRGNIYVATVDVGKKRPKNVIVLSNELVIDSDVRADRHKFEPTLDDNRRCEGFTIGTTEWSGLRVLAVHSWDRINHPEEGERVLWGTRLRAIIQGFWKSGPLAVLGDFNANPWDREITSRDGLFATREKDRSDDEEAKLANLERFATPLFNPMWRLLGHDGPMPSDPRHGQGTIHFKKNDVAWHLFDQIVVSHGLRHRIASVAVLARLGATSLVSEDGVPKKVHSTGADGKRRTDWLYSDHLPVQSILRPAIRLGVSGV